MSAPDELCGHCGGAVLQTRGSINRAIRAGLPLYCGKVCAGLARRKPKLPEAERKELKSAYDRRRRVEMAERLRAEKAAYHKRTYDPARAAEVRAARMPYHVEYCRQPAYRAKKSAYDRKHLASKKYGDFADAALILRDLEAEVLTRASRYDIDLAAGRLNKVKQRKRDYAQSFGG